MIALAPSFVTAHPLTITAQDDPTVVEALYGGVSIRQISEDGAASTIILSSAMAAELMSLLTSLTT
jgi:hypothetical protein